MATKTFTVDRARLERYRAEADAARGASRSASDRVSEARYQLREAREEVQRLEHSHMGAQYLGAARSRVEAAQKEVARLDGAQREGAAARQHVTTLFARLEAYAQGVAR